MADTQYFVRVGQDIRLRSDTPQWVIDWVEMAHDGETLNNWRMAICGAIFNNYVIDPEFDFTPLMEALIDDTVEVLTIWAHDEESNTRFRSVNDFQQRFAQRGFPISFAKAAWCTQMEAVSKVYDLFMNAAARHALGK